MMETPLFLFLYHLLIFILVVVLLFAAGEGLLAILKMRSRLSYNGFIRNVFIGYVLSVSSFALISSRFVSIHIVYIFLLVLAIVEAKRSKAQIEEVYRTTYIKPNYFIVVGLLLLVYCWSWFSIYNPDSVVHFNHFGDNILYSKISKSIAETGFENGFYFLNAIDPYYHGPEPYHYFDLWGGSLIGKLFSLNHYLGLQLVIYPLFYFLAGLSLYRSVKNLRPIYAIGLSVLLLFLTGFYAPVYEQFAFLGWLRNFSFNTLTPWANKLSFFYVFFFCAFGLYAHGLKTLAVVCFLGLTAASIISLPVLVGSLTAVLGYEYMRKPVARPELLRQLLYVVSTAGFIVMFYVLFQRKSAGLAGVEITSPINLLVESLANAQWVTQRNIVIGGLLHLAIYYLPLVPVLILFVRLTKARQEDHLVFFGRLLLVMILVSLLGWALLYREVNAFEVYIVVLVPFLNAAFALMVVSILSNFSQAASMSKGNLALTLTLTVIVVVQQAYNSLPDERIKSSNQYSNDYFVAVREMVTERSLRRGVSIKDKTMLEEHHLKFNTVYPMGAYLTLMNESVAVVNVGDFNTPIDSSSALGIQRSMKAISIGTFYRYVVDRVGGRPNTAEVDSLQASFVRDHQIEFLILSPKVNIPESLVNQVIETITDKHTGERFVLLRRPDAP